ALAAVVGWPQGYRSPAAYASFWLLLVLAGFAASAIERRAFAASTAVDRAMRTTVIAFAAIVVCGMVLSAAGWLTLPSYIVFFALVAAAATVWARGGGTTMPEPIVWRPFAPTVLALAGAVAVFVVAVGTTHLPTRYDSLNYHLYFPARWLLDQ